LELLSTSKAERYLRRRRKSRVSNHSLQKYKRRKSLSKEYNHRGYPPHQGRRKLKREGALTQMEINRGTHKKLLSLRYLKNHNK
jgi:hypothetical protein